MRSLGETRFLFPYSFIIDNRVIQYANSPLVFDHSCEVVDLIATLLPPAIHIEQVPVCTVPLGAHDKRPLYCKTSFARFHGTRGSRAAIIHHIKDLDHTAPIISSGSAMDRALSPQLCSQNPERLPKTLLKKTLSPQLGSQNPERLLRRDTSSTLCHHNLAHNIRTDFPKQKKPRAKCRFILFLLCSTLLLH